MRESMIKNELFISRYGIKVRFVSRVEECRFGFIKGGWKISFYSGGFNGIGWFGGYYFDSYCLELSSNFHYLYILSFLD
jgi:hypothetical protein